jgi:transcriptional regulator with XRE-family HTH domain
MNFRVKEICKSKGILMEDLAGMLGVTPNTLTRNINGNPTIETLGKIAVALSVPVTELFEQQGNDIINCPKCGARLELKEK